MGSVDSPKSSALAFGTEIREQCFSFAEGYRPLNHGSFGTFPKVVRDYQRQLQGESEARPDTFMRYTYPKLLRESKAAIAPLLGADPGEVVFVQNATTGINTVLRNLKFEERDVIIHFSTIYGACRKTIQSLSEGCPVRLVEINITYPISNTEIVLRLQSRIYGLRMLGQNPRLVIFDTVLTFPGVVFPFERLILKCRELEVLSFVDGAHGVGHIDLTRIGLVKPDFFVSNCYKWLMVPRGCAVLYVPFRNQDQDLISSTVPTSWGYETKEERGKLSSRDYFSKLFDKISTTDNTPYCCIPVALEFRAKVCGGEAKIRRYCEWIASVGGHKMAEILGTEVLGEYAEFQHGCFINVRLPLTLADLNIEASAGRGIAKWMQELTPAEYETYIPIKFYTGGFWCRTSGQVYLMLEDFEWAAKTLLLICKRAKAGEWK
ncbi:hypothetical protein CNYM01_06401 [Colletotrichum nymphaeae SA-01]|uniref:Aminotransferase class V domain-containing protein n=1 Tax=Colletotrichum nymphaeae SA-01 TaxID=1460502 RepID=A0A135TEX1_9PEZI|nr:hypothetical protein CNYM01_06401 [Colletotrichum nymphaeae SA-01]